MTEFDIKKIEDVLWSITDKCNLNCIYCSVVEDTSYIPVMKLSEDKVDHVIRQLETLSELKSLILSGGESLLTNNLPYILKKSVSLCPNIYIITNGTVLTSEVKNALHKYKPTIMVTIDSLNENINRLTRGAGSLRKTISTLCLLQKMGLTIVIISVVTNYNIGNIIDDLNFYYGRGLYNVLLQQLHCEGLADGELFMQLSPAPTQIDVFYKNLIRFEKHHPKMNIDYNEICYYPMRKNEYYKKCNPSQEYRPQRIFMCGAGFNFFAIKTNGDIIPCNALRECILGNIFQEKLGDILALSKEAMNIRKLRAIRVDSITGCKDCVYAPICDGGCRADVLHLAGDILNKHPYCNVKNMNCVLDGTV